jgi:hypothetical protein
MDYRSENVLTWDIAICQEVDNSITDFHKKYRLFGRWQIGLQNGLAN